MIILNITAFLGRFHPVLVHLPIGFIIIAILIEWRLKDERYQKPISYAWLLSGVTGSIAALMGWFLANQGSYDNWTLFFHRWLGISVALISFYAWWIRKGKTPNKKAMRLTNLSAIILILITGHLGGNMTHGADYLLEYAPSPIQKLLGFGNLKNDLPQFNNPDSVFVYNDIILPTLNKKCFGCHNTKVQNGGLDMTSIESMQKGGENGSVVVSGDINSELLRRVTLPTTSAKFMPTSGTHMNYHEIKLLEWWISEGAEYDKPITEIKSNPSVQSTLLSLYSLDLTPRPWIEKKIVEAPDSSVMANIAGTGLKINRLAQNNGWVEVGLPIGSKITKEQLESLEKASEQITWLNFANSGLTDEDLSIIGQLPHLTKVRIHDNDITSLGVQSLSNLNYLESLNIIKTGVDDSVFEILPSLNSLRNLYVWQTNVTQEGVNSATNSNPNIQIEYGISLE